MGQIFEVPFNSGQDESVDRSLLPDKLLRAAQNCRLARDGRLEVRPTFTALSASTLSGGTLVAYDVTNYAGRLVALGDSTSASRATDLFEWVASQSAWRGTAGASSAVRLPSLTSVRRVGSLPDQPAAARNVAMATNGTLLCTVINTRIRGSITGGELGTVVHVLDTTTDQTVLCERIADLKMARVVFAGSSFFIFGVNAAKDIVSHTALTTISAPTTRVALAGDMLDLALGTFGTGFVLAYSENGSNTVAFRYDSAGVQQATWVVDAADSSALAVVGNTGGTLVSVIRADDAAQTATIETFNAAGVTQSGPTTLFSSAVCNERLGACLIGSDVFCVAGSGRDVVLQRATQATHALGSLRTYFTADLEMAPVTVGTRAFFGVNDRAPGAITFHLLDEAQLLPQVYIQFAAGISASENSTHTGALIGTKLYFATTALSEDTGNLSDERRFQVFEAETSGTARRQMMQLGGELAIAGGVPLTYDGRALAESGLAERPSLSEAAPVQAAGGSLTLLGVYNAIPVWEVFDGRGRLLHSQAGDARAVTLTGVNNQITWTITTPHSLRRHANYSGQGLSVRVRLYRTEAGEGVFFLDVETTVALTSSMAQNVTVVSTQSDVALTDNLILYEQSQTPVSHVSPPPYQFAAPTRERPFIAGLPETEGWTAGKQLFPSEPVEYAPAGQLGFSGRVGQPIAAVAAFEQTMIAWTTQEIYAITGRGPERNGVGEFDAATSVPTPGGCIDWRSVIVAPPGAFFQMRSDRLMLLDRGFNVTWKGAAVQDTLALYPTIVGAVFVRELDQVVFACNNLAGNDGVFIVYDLSADQWFVDPIGAAITSVSELDGRLVYVAAGAVLQQNASVGSGAGALPAFRVDTGSFRPFSALGYGDLIKVGVLGTYLGDATVTISVSYDDGKTFPHSATYAVTAAAWTNAITGAAIAVGDPVTLLFTPNIRTTDRFSVRVEQSSATNTGGIRLHVLSYEVEALSGTVRRSARDSR